jgi:LAO/AO transport system kinase
MTGGDADGDAHRRPPVADGGRTGATAGAATDGEGADDDLVDRLLTGDHRALARVITRIENRAPGYRDVVSSLYRHAGDARIVGVTGSPGAGKSTLVDKLARAYRDRGLTVGVIAVDPSSPYTGGAVLGDRIRMASNVGDMDVFFRSMSARGQLGGLATATADAVTALDAFGKDRIVIETVGAGQNEVDVVRTADTVVVLVQPGSGDDVQMLKAGILEIGDLFVVNKADVDGADRTVAELEEMVHAGSGDGGPRAVGAGHHGAGMAVGTGSADGGTADDADADPDANGDDGWTSPVLRTVATDGEGVEALLDALDDHHDHLVRTGSLAEGARTRAAEEIRQLVRGDAAALLESELDRHGGVDELAAAVVRRETDPYAVADRVLEPVRDCLADGDPDPDPDPDPGPDPDRGGEGGASTDGG